MHVVVSKRDLLRVLNRCQGVADKKSTMPVLANVLLEAEGDRLRLAATDLYLAVSARIPGEVQKRGAIAVGARDLYERVRAMPDGQVALSTNDGSLTTVRALGTARRYTLHGIPADEFPALPQLDEGAQALEIPVDTLASMITATYFSISTDETRLALNSALFEWDADHLRMVTTDGHRLSKIEVTGGARTGGASMLIPLKGVLELRRLCDEAKAEATGEETPALRLSQSGPSVFFQVGGLTLSVKLVDAQFPPYGQVIPASSAHHVQAPRALFADALRAVSLAASERTGGVKLSLSGGKMRIESESPESGEGFDELAVEYSGPDLTIGFNARYFLDVLSAAADGDEVSLGMSGELDPAVIRPAGKEGTELLAVIMPMRI